jgi:hypothetical protein
MKEYLVSVTISTEVQLVVEAKSKEEAGNKALATKFVVAEKSEVPEVVLRNSVITIAATDITPENSKVLTEITNPNLKKRIKDDGT